MFSQKYGTVFSATYLLIVITGCQAPLATSVSINAQSEAPAPTATPSPSPTPLPTPSPLPSPSPTPVPSGTVEVLVAVGKVGRSIISCDQGVTWIQNRSENDNSQCWASNTSDPNYVECDHHVYSTTGLTYRNGWFLKTMGWGSPGSIHRSQDGVYWENVLSSTMTNELTFTATLAGNGRFMLGPSHVSTQDGAAGSWQSTGTAMWALNIGNIRMGGFSTYGTGRFFVQGDSGLLYTTNHGANWVAPTSIPAACSGMPSNVVSNGAVVVRAMQTGLPCYSIDGGATWYATALDLGSFTTPVLWTGAQFIGWGFNTSGQRAVFRSNDGVTWTSATTTGLSNELGPVAVTSTGVYVGINGNWGGWYASQKFYRSTNGVNWTESTSYTKSHPMGFILPGQIPANTYCP